MLGFRFVMAVLVTFVALLFLGSSARAFALPKALLRAADSEELEDTCQCDCCYSVGQQGRTECIPPIDTSFDTPRCSGCDVEACAKAFPVSCGQQSSVVSTDCIKRKGWMLRIVPVAFIAASLSLLLYGLFFKTYDGYHDDSRPPPTVTEVLRPSKIAGFGTFPSSYGIVRDGERQNLIARTATTLPPISEHAEVAVAEDSLRDEEAARTVPTRPDADEIQPEPLVTEPRE